MMHNKYIFLKGVLGICVLGAMLLTSCTDKFKEFNTDPNRLTDKQTELDLLSLGGMFPSMMVDIIPTSDVDANEYQRAQNLAGDIFSGYMAAIGTWNGGSHSGTYNLYFDEWGDVAFKVAFRIMGSWAEIKEKAEKYDQSSTFAVAEILKVLNLHRITDMYGPMPYSKIGQGALGSAYDSQEEVYHGFFTDLDAAIHTLDEFMKANPGMKPLKKFDLIYEGDYKKWVIFANSLKLRLAMRIVYADPVLAQKKAEEAVNHPLGVMTNNNDNAILKSALGVQVFNPLVVCWDRYADCRMGASMESFLKGYSDPRMGIYFNKATGLDDYYGVRNGLALTSKGEYEKMSTPAIYANTPIRWMCAAEIYFLRAEGAMRKWDMNGTAKELYEEGIRMSFDQHGVSASYTTYVSDNTLTPAYYADKAGSNNAMASTAITIAWNEEAADEEKQERIITQKWLAMYPEGQEAWSEFRRTGYPKIFKVVSNKSAGTVSTDIQVRRLLFPQSEYRANKAEVDKAITLLGGPDSGGTKLWWDKK